MSLAGDTRDQLCENLEKLEERVILLTRTPSPRSLQDAREAWQQAHESWRIWRLMEQVALGGKAPSPPPRIDDFPILPGYLDRVPGYPASGLVFSEVPLGPDALTAAHQSTDLYYGVLGLHPLEFMLWGIPDAKGQPSRKAEGFIDQAKDDGTVVPAPARRRTLAVSMAALLNLELSGACARPQFPAWLPSLALQVESQEKRTEALLWWLEELQLNLQAWLENPEGEDRNGMPLWHSAFARTDFAELSAELEWLQDNLWPSGGPKKSAAEPLFNALDALDSLPSTPLEAAQAQLRQALDASAGLAAALAPVTEPAAPSADAQ